MIMKLTDEVKVSLVTAACILALAVITKTILNVQLDIISQYGPVWIYIAYISTRGDKKKSNRYDSLAFWSLLIIAVTAATIALYTV
jgi:hypothetical protein